MDKRHLPYRILKGRKQSIVIEKGFQVKAFQNQVNELYEQPNRIAFTHGPTRLEPRGPGKISEIRASTKF